MPIETVDPVAKDSAASLPTTLAAVKLVSRPAAEPSPRPKIAVGNSSAMYVPKNTSGLSIISPVMAITVSSIPSAAAIFSPISVWSAR